MTGLFDGIAKKFVILRRRGAPSRRTREISLVEAATLGAAQFPGAWLARGREIPGSLLGVHLDRGVLRHQIVGDRDLLADRDALRGQRLMFHVRHRDPTVDAANAEPVEDVRHQLLEAHVLHAGDALGAAEIGVGAVAALLTLPRVVDEELGDLAESAALLAVIDDDADPALLRGLDADLDAVHQIGPASANIRAEDVRAVALVM